MTEAENDGWRAIETAPKETDVLLICVARLYIPPVVAGFFSRNTVPGWYPFEHPETAIRFDPTHWRPLPPPPADPHTAGLAAVEPARDTIPSETVGGE